MSQKTDIEHPEVAGYLDELRVSRRLSPNTILAYRSDLVRLVMFATQLDRAPETLDRHDLEAFVRLMSNRPF